VPIVHEKSDRLAGGNREKTLRLRGRFRRILRRSLRV